MNCIDSSGIRKVFDLAKTLKNPINLSIGLPDFDLPDELKQTAIETLKKGYNKYTVTQGIEELRTGIAHDLKKRQVESEQILITSGVSGGIFLAFQALFNPGDEVIVPDPYFVMYKHLLNFIGAKPVYVNTYPDFIMTSQNIEAKITTKTKAIILNSPSNPTGICLTLNQIKDVTAIAQKHNLLIISDEIYRHFVYDIDFHSPAELYKNTLILDGFSKSYAMTGWRLGYAAGPTHIIEAMTKLQQYSFVCAPSVAQYMGVKALHLDFHSYYDAYMKKRDFVYNSLKDHYIIQKSQGAFYFFIQAPHLDGAKFAEKAIENSLLIIPGSVFSEKNTHFRLSFAASDDTLARGMDVLIRLCQGK